ncbi:NAD+ synthase [Balneola sp. EhC07]|uniref:NAD+ synthase n=1 Tax=Balneola sp. EhC07 TaxID=1849360 RepID=UPI0007F4321A|nr:NAD+ synthase [Balneola sp. EhC07]OAN62502.1 NAD+ synthase [Balneola sp. EhC07]
MKKSSTIRLAQLNPTIGDLIGNKNLITEAIRKASEDKIDILILPELIVCGYPPQDLLERAVFRESCYRINNELIESTGETAVIFGSISENHGTGRKIFNSAIVAQNGKEIARVHKALLPTYDVFDDLRYFEPGNEFEPISINGVSFGITVCEDIWFNDNEINYHTYSVNPAEVLADKGAQAIINVSASPFTKTKPVSRVGMLQKHADELNIPLFYVNQVGANTELIFDGDSLALNKDGEIKSRAKRFASTYIDVEFDPSTKEVEAIQNTSSRLDVPERIESMFNGLVLGVQDYLKKSKAAKKVILGLSGGIDSALVAVIAKEALGAENVIAVTMPSEFSSAGSVSDSETLAQNLGIKLHEITIKSIYDSYLDQLKPVFEGTEFNVAEENLQSRTRGDLLMAMANKFGYMLLNTGNKSETAVGYCTLYGDMAGGLGVISDLYKTEVFEMCKWLNQRYYQKEVIPNSIIEKEPSAELRPDQKDSDSLPDYGTLDTILEYYLEQQLSREEIIDRGYEEKLVDKILRLVDINEHKRYQSAPGLKMSAKAFGSGRRWPVVQGWSGQENKFKKSISSKQ